MLTLSPNCISFDAIFHIVGGIRVEHLPGGLKRERMRPEKDWIVPTHWSWAPPLKMFKNMSWNATMATMTF